MRFVKFGDEYVAASRIVRVLFRSVKEGQPSPPDPYRHDPQPKDKDIAVAEVTIEGWGSVLLVRGDAALGALRQLCEREVVAIS